MNRDRQAYMMNKETDKHTDGEMKRDRPANRKTDRQAHRKRLIDTDRHTERRIERQTANTQGDE